MSKIHRLMRVIFWMWYEQNELIIFSFLIKVLNIVVCVHQTCRHLYNTQIVTTIFSEFCCVGKVKHQTGVINLLVFTMIFKVRMLILSIYLALQQNCLCCSLGLVCSTHHCRNIIIILTRHVTLYFTSLLILKFVC